MTVPDQFKGDRFYGEGRHYYWECRAWWTSSTGNGVETGAQYSYAGEIWQTILERFVRDRAVPPMASTVEVKLKSVDSCAVPR